jgi:hypothetical protein
LAEAANSRANPAKVLLTGGQFYLSLRSVERNFQISLSRLAGIAPPAVGQEA